VEPEDGVYDGPVLRRIRLSRGVELEDISVTTKINETYLRFIEENRYQDLPAPVYVRGFLREYSKCLHLDPNRVTQSYMDRLSSRPGGPRP
jgi:flagellar biosynthesis protein FlhG